MKKLFIFFIIFLVCFQFFSILYSSENLNFFMTDTEIWADIYNNSTKTWVSHQINVLIYNGNEKINKIIIGLYYNDSKHKYGINLQGSKNIRQTAFKTLNKIAEMFNSNEKKSEYYDVVEYGQRKKKNSLPEKFLIKEINKTNSIKLEYNDCSWKTINAPEWNLSNKASMEFIILADNPKYRLAIQFNKVFDMDNPSKTVTPTELYFRPLQIWNIRNCLENSYIKEQIKQEIARTRLDKIKNKYEKVINVNKWSSRSKFATSLAGALGGSIGSANIARAYKVFAVVDEYILFMHKDSTDLLAIKQNQLGEISEGQSLYGMVNYIGRKGNIKYKNLKGFLVTVPLYIVLDEYLFKK